MFWQSITAIALFAQDASARGQFLRFGCAQLVVQRADPLVNPGSPQTPHTHQIVGGNSFNISMDPKTHDPPALSTCTSCTMAEDFSNYWTASLYFRSPENGSFMRVSQRGDGIRGQTGGLTAYYMEPFSGTNMKTTSFKPGFRMLAGNPSLRTAKGAQSGICHRCNGNGDGFAPCDNKDTNNFPLKMCPGGIRATIIFPSCWDGKNLDSVDHYSHLAYSTAYSNGTGLAGDTCPSSHPVRVPQVMYEVQWDTKPFNKPEYFKDGKQPFVYSFGDSTGHGQHGDYLFGWKGDALQRAMDNLSKTCATGSCQAPKTQPIATANACTIKQYVPEDVGLNGWLDKMPGGVTNT